MYGHDMGIKQDRTPSKPLKLDQVSVSLPKETIHGSLLWSNAFVDENVTIDPNAMMLVEYMLHIFQQRPKEGILSFATFDHAIRNISKDIDAKKA
jgi:hypothetical protein